MLRIGVLVGMLAVVAGSADAQITADQAIEAVRRFAGDTHVGLRAALVSGGSAETIQGPYYQVHLANDRETPIFYRVRAADGVVFSMYRVLPSDVLDDGYNPDGTEKDLPIPQTQAEEIARDFARRHYPDFDRRVWFSFPPPIGFCQRGWQYVFTWYEVLSKAGTLAPWPLEVVVSGYSGNVVTYTRPPDGPVLASVQPRVGRRQAAEIAQSSVASTTGVVAIEALWLQIAEDVLGVQRLAWHVHLRIHSPGARVREPMLTVDALTGDVLTWSAPFGSASRTVPPDHTAGGPTPHIRLASRHGSVGSLVRPVVAGSTLWARAEHLRAVEGVRVDVDRQGVAVRYGEIVLKGNDLGARWRDYGWWVPLRQAARVLGWRVDWNNAKKEAVIYAR